MMTEPLRRTTAGALLGAQQVRQGEAAEGEAADAEKDRRDRPSQ